MVVAGLGLTALMSCTDDNDWSTDSSYDRMFGVSDISVDAKDTRVGISFTTVSGATGYLVEMSTDSLYLDDVSESSIVSTLTSSPDTVYNLAGETRYYLRMRTLGEKTSSLWNYYRTGSGKYYFTTAAEQIFNGTTSSDYDDSSIHVSWDADAEVTNLVLKIGDEEVQNVTLTDADKTAAEYTFTGLNPTTTYTVEIYNGDKRRGTLNITTAAAMPSADYKYYLDSDVTVITQDLLNEIAAEAQAEAGSTTSYSATIGIPAGITFDIHGTSDTDGSSTTVQIPDGMSVTFFGLSGGDAPVLNLSKSVNIAGSHAYISFENLEITDGGCQYFINQSVSGTVDKLSFTQCTIHDFERSLVRTQGSVAITISNILVDNCILTNMSTGNGYSVFYFGTATTTVDKLELTNSTFDTSQRSFIEASQSPISNGVHITNCTFYNNVASARYFMDANGQSTDLTMTNVILGKSYSDTAKGIRTTGEITISSSIRASDCIYSSNDITSFEAGSYSSSDIFTDPDNHDFTLKINDWYGDSRWYPEE